MKVVLLLEYHGTAYCGWQRQDNGLSIQEVLETALATYLRSQSRKQALQTLPALPSTTACGRTDAGVHAKGQVVSFTWPENLQLDAYHMQGALNGLTPRDIAILSVDKKPDDFDARFSPSIKCYQYRIFNRLTPPTNPAYPAWHVPSKLDWAKMQKVCSAFLGTHDFSAFRASDANQKSSVRKIDCAELSRISANEFCFTVVGQGFLKQMVRIMVGTLVDVGTGAMSTQAAIALLDSGQRKGAGKTAPSRGLTLEWVRYTEQWERCE